MSYFQILLQNSSLIVVWYWILYACCTLDNKHILNWIELIHSKRYQFVISPPLPPPPLSPRHHHQQKQVFHPLSPQHHHYHPHPVLLFHQAVKIVAQHLPHLWSAGESVGQMSSHWIMTAWWKNERWVSWGCRFWSKTKLLSKSFRKTWFMWPVFFDVICSSLFIVIASFKICNLSWLISSLNLGHLTHLPLMQHICIS